MGILNYVKESYKELNNEVTWVPLSEAQKSTIIVAIFTIIFALAVFFTDKVFQNALDWFYKIFN